MSKLNHATHIKKKQKQGTGNSHVYHRSEFDDILSLSLSGLAQELHFLIYMKSCWLKTFNITLNIDKTILNL